MPNDTLVGLLDAALRKLWKVEGDRHSVVMQLNAALAQLAEARALVISRDAEIKALTEIIDRTG